MAPPCSAHVQLDDVPRTPIQPSAEGEFRQHDGMVTMMMFYRRRASPKHRYDMIEVDYGGGGRRTRLRGQEIKGRHRAERVLNAEVPYVRYLDRLDREDIRLHQPRYLTLPLSVYEGTWTHSPRSLLCFS